MTTSAAIEFEYTNWVGRKSLRQAIPISVRFGTSEWHPEPQWLMLAHDLDKCENREFAMADMTFDEDKSESIMFTPWVQS